MTEPTEDTDPYVRMCPVDDTPMNMRDVFPLVHCEAGYVCSQKCADIIHSRVVEGYDFEPDRELRNRALQAKAALPKYDGPGVAT